MLNKTEQLIRKTGIDILDNVPWSSHFCLFYETKEDLIDILVPYFKAGLENNEFCVWVTSEPLNEKKARDALRDAIPDFDRYLRKEQIRIIPDSDLYLKDNIFNLQRVLDTWADQLNQALSSGFAGMRVAGDMNGFGREVWEKVADYEKEVNNVIGKYQMLAICGYCIDECETSEIIEVASCHQSAIIRRKGKWEVIEGGERKKAEEEIKNLAKFPEENSNPVYRTSKDGVLLYANPAGRRLIFKDQIKTGDKIPEKWIEMIKNVYASGKKQQAEMEISGRVFLFDMVPVIEGGYVNSYATDITEHKQAEETLKCERDNLSNIFKVMNDGVYMVDQQYDIQYVNRVLQEQYGPWKGIKCYTYFHDRTEICPWCPNQKVFAGETVRWEWYSEKNGKTYDLIDTPMKGPGGSILKLEIFRDITERKQAEEQLQEERNLLRAVIDHIPDKVYVKDKNSRFVTCNKATLDKEYLKSETEIIGKTDFDLYDRKTAQELFDVEQELMRTGKPSINLERQHIDKTGNLLSTLQTKVPWLDSHGNIVGIVGINRDITKRKQAEEALRTSEIRYRTLIEEISEKVFLKDINSVYISCSENYAKDFKIKAEEIAGKTDYDFYPKELAEKYRADDRRIIKSGETEDTNEKYIQNGRELIIHTVKTPVRDKEGNVTGILGVFWDITAQRQAQKKLLTYQKQLRDLASEMSLAEERQCKHIATELHDQVTQNLILFKINIGKLRGGGGGAGINYKTAG